VISEVRCFEEKEILEMTALTKKAATAQVSLDLVQRLTKDISNLRDSIAASEARQSELEQERKSLLLPARLSKDNAAQKRLHAIDEELNRLKYDTADDGKVAEDLSKQLEQVQYDLAIAAWEDERASVRKILLAGAEDINAKRIEKATSELVAALQEAKGLDNKAASALIQFDRSLKHEMKRISSVSDYRSHVVAFLLRDFLPVDLRGLLGKWPSGNINSYLRPVYDDAIEALDRLEVIS
jgi:hypothetical protein